ncbi:MAG: hypothetical protein ABIR59_05070 [Gemmatimonadales bacterium]
MPDAEALRQRLHRRGPSGMPVFSGRLFDRRYDIDGELAERREVLRVRRYKSNDGSVHDELAWKGPTTVSPQGYKARPELECRLGAGASISDLLAALGYSPVHAVDRFVEVYAIEGATVRLEWYPECDTLVEVEGDADAIERAIATLDIPRETFTAEGLAAFTARFARRTGRPARVALHFPDEHPAHWPR